MMMDTGHKLGLILLYVVMAGSALLMLRIFIQIMFRGAIEKYRRRQFTEKNGGAYTFRAFDGKRGWANTWLPRNPELNQPAQNGVSAGKLAGTAPIIKQAIALVSILIAFGLAGTVAAQRGASHEVSASAPKQQLFEIESKETQIRMRLEELDEQLKPESIERELAGIGSVHPEELREHRRKLLTIERNGLQTQLDLLEEDRARIETAITAAGAATYFNYMQPSPGRVLFTAPAGPMTQMVSKRNFAVAGLPLQKLSLAVALLVLFSGGLSLLLIIAIQMVERWIVFLTCRMRHKLEGTMIILKPLIRGQSTLLILLCAQFFLPVYPQAQKCDSLTAVAKGYGVIADRFEERKFTGALAVLRQDGTLLITLYSDLQLQVQGTWSSSDSSPEEILLKITGGELSGNVTGTGKLSLSADRKSIRELTIKGRSFDGREITLTFVAAASESARIEQVNLVSSGP
jgi:hypothetical protein